MERFFKREITALLNWRPIQAIRGSPMKHEMQTFATSTRLVRSAKVLLMIPQQTRIERPSLQRPDPDPRRSAGYSELLQSCYVVDRHELGIK